MRTLFRPRRLRHLGGDAQGQAATEWLLVTAVGVLPLVALIPVMLKMINLYFNRVAEVISSPFP
jgi:uncharacterized membrane protein